MTYPENTTHYSAGKLDDEGLANEWVQLEKKLGFRPAVNLSGTLAENRKAYDDAVAKRDATVLSKDLLHDVTAENVTIATKDGASVSIRIFHPITLFERVRPTAIYTHGGGWELGTVDGDELFCRQIAHESNHVVVSVDYRRSPEHTFPTATEDSFAAYEWIVENADGLNIDPENIYVTGSSAGDPAHLAAALAIKIAQEGISVTPKAQVLRAPLTVHPKAFPGKLPGRPNTPIINDKIAETLIDSYVAKEADRTNPLVSPLLAPDVILKKLPPTYIELSTVDPFFDGGLAYANKLESLGVPVKLYVLDGLPHVPYLLFQDLPIATAAHKSALAGTEWALMKSQKE